MKLATKKIIFITTLALLLTGSCLAYLTYSIREHGAQLAEDLAILNEQQAKEDSYFKIGKLVTETEGERATLNSLFFTDESDSINFLGSIENLAAEARLKLEVEELSTAQGDDKKTEYVTVSLRYSGARTSVDDFTRLLETIPYHSWIESYSLTKSPDNRWEGRMKLYITLLPS